MHVQPLFLRLLAGVMCLLLGAAACSRAEVLEPDQGSSLQDRVALAATAEAQTTSTAFVDYAADIDEARAVWAAAGVDHYLIEVTYNEGRGSFQTISALVENGQVVTFEHDCTPPSVCFLIPVEEQRFTVPGLLGLLTELAADQIPLSVLRFNSEFGYPQAVGTNSDKSPILRIITVEKFEVLDN